MSECQECGQELGTTRKDRHVCPGKAKEKCGNCGEISIPGSHVCTEVATANQSSGAENLAGDDQ